MEESDTDHFPSPNRILNTQEEGKTDDDFILPEIVPKPGSRSIHEANST